MSVPDQYGVMGFPVAHSKSPLIHEMFAKQTEQSMNYGRLEVKPEDFNKIVTGFFSQGGRGLNITLPHKESAWAMASWHSDNAERAGAVNTLYLLEDGRLAGDNTDGIGLVRDIVQNHNGELCDKHILILGAGGAVRGILPRLLSAQPASVTLVNRTVQRANALAKVFADQIKIKTMGYDELSSGNGAYDWVINGSSAGLQGEMTDLPATLINTKTWCYDMVYAPGGTVFQKWANANRAMQALDGLGMLVEQAAESFFIWRGLRPDTAPVIAALRSSMS